MKFKCASTKDKKSYSDTYIRTKLEEWYGKDSVVKLQDFLYVVNEKGYYYLMNSRVPEIFFTSCGTLLKGVTSIEINKEYAKVEACDERGDISLLEGHISSVINELLNWKI
jgi:hypothetical protein